jgi:hypothetical protein
MIQLRGYYGLIPAGTVQSASFQRKLIRRPSGGQQI